MKFSKLKICVCLGFAYCLLLAALVGSTWSSIDSLRLSADAARHIVNVNVKNVELMEEMSRSVHIVSRALWMLPLLSDEAARARELEKIDEAQQKYNTSAAALAVMPFDANGQRLVFEIAEDHAVAVSIAHTLINMSKVSRDDAATFLLQSVIPINTTWQEQIERLLSLEIKKNKAEMAMAEQNYQASLNTMTGMAVLVNVVVLSIAWMSVKLLGKQSVAAASIEESEESALIQVQAQVQAQAGAGNMTPPAWQDPLAGLPDTQLSIARARSNPATSPALEPSMLLQEPSPPYWRSVIGKMQQLLMKSRLVTAPLNSAATIPTENTGQTKASSGSAAKSDRLAAACDKFLARQTRTGRAASSPRQKPVLRLVSNRAVKTGC